jgi:hypothetical protein
VSPAQRLRPPDRREHLGNRPSRRPPFSSQNARAVSRLGSTARTTRISAGAAPRTLSIFLPHQPVPMTATPTGRLMSARRRVWRAAMPRDRSNYHIQSGERMEREENGAQFLQMWRRGRRRD